MSKILLILIFGSIQDKYLDKKGCCSVFLQPSKEIRVQIEVFSCTLWSRGNKYHFRIKRTLYWSVSSAVLARVADQGWDCQNPDSSPIEMQDMDPNFFFIIDYLIELHLRKILDPTVKKNGSVSDSDIRIRKNCENMPASYDIWGYYHHFSWLDLLWKKIGNLVRKI